MNVTLTKMPCECPPDADFKGGWLLRVDGGPEAWFPSAQDAFAQVLSTTSGTAMFVLRDRSTGRIACASQQCGKHCLNSDLCGVEVF